MTKGGGAAAPAGGGESNHSLATFCQFIPLRLSPEERILLQVLEQCLHVSEYTDHVDIAGRRGNKVRRILDGILEAAHIATGLTVASGKESALYESLNNINNNTAANASSDSSSSTTTATATTNEDAITCTGSSSITSSPLSLSNNHKDSTLTSEQSTKNHIKGKAAKLKERLKEGGSVHTRLNKNGKKATKGKPPPPQLAGNIASKLPKDNALLFQTMFEVGRRNKVLNPSSMRSTYGKLMYLLQDAQSPTVAKSLGFSLHKELILVTPYLQEYGCDSLLQDKRLLESTLVVSDRDGTNGLKLSRQEIDKTIARQRDLRQQLIQEYSAPNSKLTTDQVERVLESIRDAMAYIDANVRPVQTMLDYLEDNFDPHAPESAEFSLQLSGASRTASTSNIRYGFSAFATSGSTGPTLSHSHSTQYTFCWQSLKLWEKVQRNMHKLWVCADDDLLSISTSYQLYNTGQGLHRVQSCPKVAKVMRSLLTTTQSEAGASWVGLSVIHLGDRDVPNALMFIDKYTQIPRFLNPICSFLQVLETIESDDVVLKNYIATNFGSPDRLKKLVLCDYFKHGFDGSGDDGGSCIDGRLTSSWNWTSLIAKKKYYHAFMLSGFQGFDGDFK